MKISLNWLKDYVSIGISVDALAHKLTMAGIEVEAVHSVGQDTIFEVEVTPNRADCLNMLGIAREISAVLDKKKTKPIIKNLKIPKKAAGVQIEDKEACARYIGTVIEGVQIKGAPDWIKTRLASLGIRSINNVVDITNFSLIENGQPLHAFDFDKLIGGKIIVRRARKGEKIITIDDVERELDPSILVIADEKRPVAIAGIMGGKDTEVSSGTKNILLESAYFDPVLIRRSSRKLGLSSDSSYRFERGVDPEGAEGGFRRAAGMILEIAGGNITAHTDAAVKKSKISKAPITISLDQINSYLGADLTAARCQKILNNLEFKTSTAKKRTFKISPPSFRSDIKGPVDIIEEMARIVGYDNIPVSLPHIKASSILPSKERKVREAISQALIGVGFNEVITYSMVNRSALERSLQGDWAGIKILNPLTQDQEMMRPSMLPSLLSVAQGNLNKGQKNIRFFEIGKIYAKDSEKDTLVLMMIGENPYDWRSPQKAKADYFDLKGALEETLNRVGIADSDISFEEAKEQYLEDGSSAVLKIRSNTAGILGRVDEKVLAAWDIKEGNVWFAQVDLNGIYADACFEKKFCPPPEYPAVIRDISLAVKQEVQFRQIKNIVHELGGGILSSMTFNEEYLGEKIPQGQRGVVFSLQYQSDKRTLTEEEVNMVHDKISQALVQRLGAVKR